MDELLLSRLNILEIKEKNKQSIVEKMYVDLNFEDDDEEEENNKKNANIILCEKFLKYYRCLFSKGRKYSQVNDVVRYLLDKHQNMMTIANSVISNQHIVSSDIYLKYDEIEDM